MSSVAAKIVVGADRQRIVPSLIAVGDFSGETKVYVLITALGIAAVTALNRGRIANGWRMI